MGWFYWWYSKRFKKFPIQVFIWKNVANTLIPKFVKGRYESLTKKTATGERLTINYLVLLDEKVKIRSPETVFYQHAENRNVLTVAQMSRNEWLPVDISGTQVSIVAKEPVITKEGTVLVDKDGNTVYRTIKKPFLDTSFYLDKGELIKVPPAYVVKTHDKEQWHLAQHEFLSRFYKSEGFWDKYGSLIVMTVVLFFIIIAFVVGITKYTDLITQLTGSMDKFSSAMVSASDNIRVAVTQKVAQNVTIPY